MSQSAKVLDKQGAPSSGAWFFIGERMGAAVAVQNLEADASVSIRVSNSPKEEKPADGDVGVPHSTLGNITADIGVPLGGAFVWVRATKTANTTKAGDFTVTIASPAVFTLTAHGLETGDVVYLTTTDTLPTGLLANTTYYVVKINANTFNLATSYANATAGTPVKITTTGTQSGTHSVYKVKPTDVYIASQNPK